MVCAVPLSGQEAAFASGTSSAAVVPPLVSFSGLLTDLNGKPISGVVGVTFALYKDSQGGAPLWMETQNVYPNKTGHYTVLLGSTSSTGLPPDLFVAGEARWLGVQALGRAEQPRVSLTSVPYSLKAADAQTVGGLPASAFVLAPPSSNATSAASSSAAVQPMATGTTPVTTAGGTVNKLAKFDAAADVTSSQVFDNGTNVGIGNTAPAAKLDVSGAAIVRGLLTLPATGTATATAGKNSQPIGWAASAYNSGTKAAVNQVFRLQAEPAGNNTATTSGTLNLLYATGTAAPAETGLKISSKGLLTFASGQTFPGTGTGDGSVTSVATGLGLKGGPITKTGTLTIDTTVVPQLAAANTFTGNQTVNGNLSATGTVTGNSFGIGSYLFALGSYSLQNAFLGFAGNVTTSGGSNTAAGFEALEDNTTGSANTAVGQEALQQNNTGSLNAAAGYGALGANTAGSNNSATGAFALFHNSTGSYNAAGGGQALFSNTGDTSGDGSQNTANGYQALYSNATGNDNTATGYQALYNNTVNRNIAYGYQALFSNTVGQLETAIGYQALYSNVGDSAGDGGGNTAVGYQALYSNKDAGVYGGHAALANTAVGDHALYSNNTGYDNTASGVGALVSNTTGTYNTAVGVQALGSNTTGLELTCIGYGCTAAADGLTNATAIGAHAVVGQSNSLVLGGTGEHAVKVGIGTTAPSNILTIAQGSGHPVSDSWETYSSRRWKTNIQTLLGALGKVEQLRGVSYDLKANGKHEVGVIAEEVGTVVPEVVTWEKNGKDAQSVDYGRLTALLIEATKEQQALIHEQKEQITAQQAQIARLTRQVKTIQATLKANGRSGSEVRTVKAEGTTVRQ
jgi:hypothetical protein